MSQTTIKMTFDNGFVIVLSNLHLKEMLPADIPNLKQAILLALSDIDSGKIESSTSFGEVVHGLQKEIYFENGATIIVKPNENFTDYKEALTYLVEKD